MARRVLHIISQAHLDPVWLWPVRDGMAEALTTMQSAVDRLGEFPQFKFTRSSSETYQWVKACDPELYRSIKRLIREGRWEIVGGWVEQPDCNIPGTESFFRQGLYGQSFFEREFSTGVRVGYNVDSFGHAAGLPQILKLSGMDYYVFMRPQPEDNPHLPLLFWWESPDGAKVLTQRVPLGGYAQPYSSRASDIEKLIRSAEDNYFAPGFQNGIFWFGVGNHGGGPTKEHIQKIIDLQADESLPELRFSSVADYFTAVEHEERFCSLPIVVGELGFCLRGCYSATGKVKALNRFAEKLLAHAESACVLAENGSMSEFHAPWRLQLFNQFHDILAGSCVESTFEETRNRFGATLDASLDLATKAIYQLARRVNTREEKGSVLFVANSLPWSRTCLVQLDTFIAPHGLEPINHLESIDGEKMTIQWMHADANFGPCGMPWGKLTVAVNLPAGGYRTFRVVTTARTSSTNHQDASPLVIARQEHALGELPVSGIGDFLLRPVGVVIIKDNSDTWGHNRTAFNEEIGRPTLISCEEIESGPHVSIKRQKSRWQNSEIWMDVVRYGFTDYIQLRFRINWQEARQIAKLEIPTRIERSRVICKTAGGASFRESDGNEYPCQDWIALEGDLNGRLASIGLINDSSYSYDVDGGLIRMVLTRSAPYAEHTPFEFQSDEHVSFLDQGWQERQFWVRATDLPWQDLELDRAAQEWQCPASHCFDSGHNGSEPWEKSILNVLPPSVSVLTIKKSEQGPAIIVRIQEMAGKSVTAKVRFMHMEISVYMNAWEIKTLSFDSVEDSGIVVNALV